MIETAPFGSTGHASTRVIFGAAALGAMSQPRADRVLETLLEYGINHIDTAAAYGESELRLAPWLALHRERFFVATKTGERTRQGARESLERSLERLGIERVDLIQLHNLVGEEEWEAALGPGGALEALIEAREHGRVRFIGVTGHGTRVAAMHIRSLERFRFDSVLLPCNFTMLSQPDYARDFETLAELCQERGVALQTIKAVARRRWQNGSQPRFSWYEPIKDPAALQRAVHFVLARPGLFLNTTSDATLLPQLLEAASDEPERVSDAQLARDVATFEMEPLFIPGVSEGI
ncbi:MAG: aldo/keto reductase [Myxococcales bacterium]|nr:aldo/keto reductase [Myxococcales bacterium]